jgi:phospholipid transport system transporter-binding protein
MSQAQAASSFLPSGELTFATVMAARPLGLSAVQSGQTVFDLSAVTKIDSAGVSLLLEWQRQARLRQQVLRYVNVPALAARLMTVYGVAELLGEPGAQTN